MAATDRTEAAQTAAHDGASTQLFAVCHVDALRFAIPVSVVREVHPAVAITELPGAPDGVAGVVDVRGQLVPVLDLRSRLALRSREVTPEDVLVRVSLLDRQVLLHVDHVSDVCDIPAEARERSEDLVPGARYVLEVGRDRRGPIVVHDLDAFLTTDELSDLTASLDELERSSGRQR